MLNWNKHEQFVLALMQDTVQKEWWHSIYNQWAQVFQFGSHYERRRRWRCVSGSSERRKNKLLGKNETKLGSELAERHDSSGPIALLQSFHKRRKESYGAQPDSLYLAIWKNLFRRAILADYACCGETSSVPFLTPAETAAQSDCFLCATVRYYFTQCRW